MMYCCLYDISSTGRRSKAAQLCKDYGLIRLQKSCFFGRMEEQKKKAFELEMTKLAEGEDSICLIPLHQDTIKKIKGWGTFSVKGIWEKEAVCFI